MEQRIRLLFSFNAFFSSLFFPRLFNFITICVKHRYLNFGDIGWVIGHEITHGFDNQGRHFDGDGEYRSWWSNETDAEYEERAKCFANQYSSYNLSDSDQQVSLMVTNFILIFYVTLTLHFPFRSMET